MKTRLKTYRVNLQKRIKVLKHHFRFKQDINGITPAQEDKLRGLIALSHAEMEVYFETIALTLLDDSKAKWDMNKIVNYNLASLLIRGKRPDKNLDIGSMVFKIIEIHHDIIINNHGIKIDNIHKLFKPLGYEDNTFDTAFLSALDSFGVKRGTIVHGSAQRATLALDKQSVYNEIDSLVNGLVDFENAILKKYN